MCLPTCNWGTADWLGLRWLVRGRRPGHSTLGARLGLLVCRICRGPRDLATMSSTLLRARASHVARMQKQTLRTAQTCLAKSCVFVEPVWASTAACALLRWAPRPGRRSPRQARCWPLSGLASVRPTESQQRSRPAPPKQCADRAVTRMRAITEVLVQKSLCVSVCRSVFVGWRLPRRDWLARDRGCCLWVG